METDRWGKKAMENKSDVGGSMEKEGDVDRAMQKEGDVD